MPKVCGTCQAENAIQAAECVSCGRRFGVAKQDSARVKVATGVTLALLAVGLGWLIFRPDPNDAEVMENVAETACERAIEKTGLTGDFVHRVTPTDDGWLILTTVNSRSGLASYQCTAVRDGDVARASVELIG